MPIENRATFDLLLVECNQEDLAIFREALQVEPRLPARLHIVQDGAEALAFLARRPPFAAVPSPSLIIVNSRSPDLKESGLLPLITRLRNAQRMVVPVLMLGAATSQVDILEAYRSFVSAYAVIPEDRAVYRAAVRQLLEYWLTRVELPHLGGEPLDLAEPSHA